MAQPAAHRRPLKQAIQECELRWFHETAALAKEGEANQMALLGHMYTVGYGCKPDREQAQKWFAEASKRLGYNVLTDQPPLMSSTGPPQQEQEQQQQHTGGSSSSSRVLRSSSQGGGAGGNAVAGTPTPPLPATTAVQLASASSTGQ